MYPLIRPRGKSGGVAGEATMTAGGGLGALALSGPPGLPVCAPHGAAAASRAANEIHRVFKGTSHELERGVTAGSRPGHDRMARYEKTPAAFRVGGRATRGAQGGGG